jgi:probable O-glycosylation ligase (exosortase A-associated)
MISQNKDLILILFIIAAAVITFYRPYLGYILYVIMVFLRPQDGRPLMESYHIPMLITIFITVSFFINALGKEKKSFFPREKTFYFFLLFFVWMVISSFFAFREWFAWLKLEQFLFIVILFYLTIQMVDTEKKLKVLLLALLFCGLYFSYQMQFQGSRMIEYIGDQEFYRENLLRSNINFGQPNYMAFTMVVMFCIAMTMAIYSKRKVVKIIFLSLCPVYIYTLMQTASRGGTLSLLSVLVLFWLKTKKKILSLIIFALVLITILPVAREYFPNYFNRLDTINNPEEDVSITQREELWKMGLDFIKENPIVGIGFGNFVLRAPNSAHNSYIQIASELGIVGFLIWMVFLFTGWMNLFLLKRNMKRRDFIYYVAMGIEISLIAYCVQSLTSGIAHREFGYFIIAIGIAIKKIENSLEYGEIIEIGNGREKGI